MKKLYIYPKKGNSFPFSLRAGRAAIGRLPENDISIHDPFCSGHHALIFLEDQKYYIRDMGSKNGTFLNGQIVKSKTVLKEGDEILAGSTRIFFNRELSTDVEVTDLPAAAASINTVMQLEDVFNESDLLTTMGAGNAPVDLQSLQSEHRSLSIISEVSRALAMHMPLNKLLEHIMDLISDHLPMDRGILMLSEGNPVQLIPRVVRVKQKRLKNQKILISQSITSMAMAQHSSILIADVSEDPNLKVQESIIKLNIHSAMCVPLWNNKKIIGIIYSDRITIPEQFNKEDLRLLTLLSNLAAVKIENAKLIDKAIEKERMDKEIALAASIQKDFLPRRNPECENFEIAGKNIPCYQVGGDYYDFLPIDKSRIGVVIADVSGKGMSASLLMATLRAALYSEVQPGYDIKAMAKKLNSFIHKSSDINHFITFFYGEIKIETGEMCFVNAGHNPPVIVEKDGKTRRLKSSGLCLGMFPDSEYEVQCTAMEPGDLALLFTDGMTECRNQAQEEYSEDRLIAYCKKKAGLPAQALLDEIYGEVKSYSRDRPQMDDMTLIIVKRIS